MELVNYWTGEEARKGRTIEEFGICELGDNNQLSWFNYQSFNLNNQIVHNNGLNCLTMTL